ncbi:MAG: diguanylate cyclase [Eubacteriaceae bacterium]|nr:diguanylate cyclase [Eubacteriaceae bacterium]
MNFISVLILNMYSFVILLFILIYTLKHTWINSLHHKLYLILLQTGMLMLVVDILSRFDGYPGTIYSIFNQTGNFLVYLFSPVLPSLWLLYAHNQVFHDENKLKRWMFPLFAVNGLNAILVVVSQFYGWFYVIDEQNIYHRGPLFWFPVSITIALIVISFFIIVTNRKKIERRHYFALVFFAVPPVVCIFLQIIFYGVSIILNSLALSLLVVFFSIQNQNMNTDYLTGVYNRKKLETYMKEKIALCTESKTFSAILIDLDNFKLINDTFGHDMGDDALETSATLIKSCIRSNDFIARFGGDEFYIILDVSNKSDLKAAVSRISSSIEKYNLRENKPYNLSVSMGYAVYDYHLHMNVEEFQKQIDTLMYEDKRVSKDISFSKIQDAGTFRLSRP